MNDPSRNLEVKDLCKSFSVGQSSVQVLDGVSFELQPGQSMAVVGPSGSGKSTLLYIIGTLESADSGTVRLGSDDIFMQKEKQLASFRNQNIGFIFQEHHLLPQLTVLENVLIPAMASGRPDTATIQYANELIESVGLADRIEHHPGQLSGGQRERVAIARALVMRPTLILADEPTGNLDVRTAEQISELLSDLPRRSGTMLITVTHWPVLAEAMDRSYSLVDGRLT